MTRPRLLLLVLALLLLGLPARAEMAEALRREFHAYKDLGVVAMADSNLPDLERTLQDPAVRVLCLQVTPARLDAARAAKVLDWVRAGHTVWIYDARLAGHFGMRQFPLKAEQFRNKPEDGTMGDDVVDGLATTVLATGNHAVLAGVGQCTVFLPEIEPGVYSAVVVEGDTQPLLQFAPDSPALAALRRDGRGLVVFKPLLWTKPLSGERFQLNLLEFSAGFGVPGPGGDGRYGEPPGPEAEYVVGNPAVPTAGYENRVVATPLPKASPSPDASPAPRPPPASAPPTPEPSPEAAPQPSPSPERPEPRATASPVAFPDKVQVFGEGTLEVRVLVSEFRFETTGQSVLVPVEQVRTLNVRSPMELDRLETRDGQTLTGFLLMEDLQVAGPEGTRTLTKRQVVRIDFGDAR